VNVERGVAFPVCVSVNDVICNHSPLASEEVVSSRLLLLLLSFMCLSVCVCFSLDDLVWVT